MMNVNAYELYPRYDSRKSFYGKAIVLECNGNTYLKSYDTMVCGIVNGEFKRFWNGWSATTGRHIAEFTRQFLGAAVGKKEWDACEVGRW